MRRARRFHLLFWCLQAAVALALFVAAELWVRRQNARRPADHVASGVENPPYYNNPGKDIAFHIFDPSLRFNINSLGLRGPETAREKPAGTKRVLILGDSVAFGVLARERHNWDRLLERGLSSQGSRWEVLNAASPGYDLWDYEGYLRERGLSFHPDLVVVGIFMNDHARARADGVRAAPAARPALKRLRETFMRSELLNSLHYLTRRRVKPKGSPFAFTKPVTDHDLADLSRFYPGDPASVEALRRYLLDYKYDPAFLKDILPWLLDLRLWDAAERPLRGIRDASRRRGAHVLAVVFPMQFEVYPGYVHPEPRRRLLRILKSLGIPAVDLRAAWHETGRGDEFYTLRSDHGHPGEEAYRLAAEETLKKLRALGWAH